MNESTKHETVLQVSDLTRSYGKGTKTFWAVKGLDFRVFRGDVFGLLGTNGAGKTSTLEILEGLTPATSGKVKVFGRDPFDDRALIRPRMGIMLQSGGLPSQLTVEETIKMWQGTCSNPRDPEEILAEVELLHRLDVRVGALSGGEQRRLELGCALLGNPELLFLDEPTTGLDPESRRNVWDLLLRLKKQGVTMVLTTHYLEEAETLCDRIAIMNEGTVARQGTLSELVNSVSAEITVSSVHTPPRLPGTTITTEQKSHTIYTKQLPQDTLAVLEWARKNQLELEHFSARPASLEKVFMSIADNKTQ
ncbi:ABC transporter ATP-binding protein [Corynebacterium propinquum]|uniref:ABC transporter ATP-binding protein n=1 Tax=Corynebacterium propinquum TaxID=43769 RepID=UPI00266F671B|nr:ABC transporter ATP-binding protein [Corynebacterium propinquum]WKS31094.1 ABC transporter ATP-binding protein [Corynebacterium propinquum]WKS35469.1 ABC transporter ATP-binding protein [Corynebacterium propinquum]WKS39455.1 ABC transporter ATP-binding protein [Corynebacterium propinquum]WKS43687.1 ABC transporter ATP-binding protein [Corynebacterium propinquum]WKS47928.1 ABC transporter ATP-binding protein [Corynebacterium propinquum]